MAAPNTSPESIQRGLNPSRPERVVRVSEIGQYIQLQSCPRRFRLEVNRRREARIDPAKFEAAYRSAKSIQGALSVG
jgi:hypothetical protein